MANLNVQRKKRGKVLWLILAGLVVLFFIVTVKGCKNRSIAKHILPASA